MYVCCMYVYFTSPQSLSLSIAFSFDCTDHAYKLVGPPANCKESTTSEVMPRTLEDCKKAADALGRGFQDYTGKEGVHGETGLI